MAVLWMVGCIFALLWLTRLTFTLLFAVPAFGCLTNETSTETCGNKVFTQSEKDNMNMEGTFVEAGSSILKILLIFCWRKFNVTNFFRAVPRLAVFWFWMGLFCAQALTIINIDFLPRRRWNWLGASLLLEFASLVLLCLALKFIEKSTVKAWIYRTVTNEQNEHWALFLYCLYLLTLWMYLLRNLALLFYDMAILAKKINGHASHEQIDHLLLISNIANRGSFVQFFYAAIFRNPKLSEVCNENEARDGILSTESESSIQTVIAWEPYVK